jgi:hypothetical protein
VQFRGCYWPRLFAAVVVRQIWRLIRLDETAIQLGCGIEMAIDRHQPWADHAFGALGSELPRMNPAFTGSGSPEPGL